jgi:hypothetical protein
MRSLLVFSKFFVGAFQQRASPRFVLHTSGPTHDGLDRSFDTLSTIGREKTDCSVTRDFSAR